MSVKDIIVKPISSQDASRVVKSCHYSGKVVQNSQLHFGVFLNGKCGGAMQFGPSLDKRKMQGLVENTGWNGFIELNRMAFADWLPRNSESRAIAVAMAKAIAATHADQIAAGIGQVVARIGQPPATAPDHTRLNNGIADAEKRSNSIRHKNSDHNI